MLDRVIVISPHPDDETLGAGGAILKYKALGHKIYWLNISNMKEEYGFKKEEMRQWNIGIEKVISKYKFDGFFDLKLKPLELDGYTSKALIEAVSKVFMKVKPNIIILPYKNDIHSDHRVVFESSYACTKVFRYPYVRKVMMMEVLSETDFSICSEGFSPNYFVDISGYLEQKIKIMKLYKGECLNHPFPRSEEGIKALATIRGSQAGCKYAEGFMILKEIR